MQQKGILQFDIDRDISKGNTDMPKEAMLIQATSEPNAL